MAIEETPLPRREYRIFRVVRWIAGRKIRKAFDAARVSRGGATPPVTGNPLIVVMNHASWWDPMTAMVLSKRFPDRGHYAPIDAAMLQKYKVFGKIGLFGIEPGTRRGAVKFLRTAEAILNHPDTMLWVTSQGEFADVRRRPLALRDGVGFLAARLGVGHVLPLAVEYVFWDESKPELLVRWGEPLDIAAGKGLDGRAWTARIEDALAATMDALAEEAQARDPAAFDTLIEGKVGVGGVYGTWQRLRSWLAGRRHDPRHRTATGAEV